MTVTHVLKDGTTVEDIRGHVVKENDAKAVYALLDSINEKVLAMKEKQVNEK